MVLGIRAQTYLLHLIFTLGRDLSPFRKTAFFYFDRALLPDCIN